MQACKLLNDPLERIHKKTKVLDVFKETDIKLMEMNKERNNNKNVTYRESLEEKLEVSKLVKRQKTTTYVWTRSQ